jgi:hypothetical protein
MKRLSLQLPVILDLDFDHERFIAALRNAVNAPTRNRPRRRPRSRLKRDWRMEPGDNLRLQLCSCA